MQNTDKMITLGRFMMRNAQRFQDDAKCNSWARVGQMLTELGVPFGIKWSDFTPEDVLVVREAVAVVTGKQDMPQVLAQAQEVTPKRTRKPRMTQVMSKPATLAARTQKVVKENSRKTSQKVVKTKGGKTTQKAAQKVVKTKGGKTAQKASRARK